MNEVNKLEMEFLASIVSDGFWFSFISFYFALFLRFSFLSVFGKDTAFREVVPSFLPSFFPCHSMISINTINDLINSQGIYVILGVQDRSRLFS